MSLSPSQVEQIAARVAEMLDGRVGGPAYGDVRTVAQELGVQEWWVYDNARRLGGVKLGPGKGARWRFDMARLRRLVSSGALENAREPAFNGDAPAVSAPGSNGVHRPSPAQRPARSRPAEEGFDDRSQPMAKLDLSGRFTAINPAFSRLIGYAEADFTRARWPSPHDREQFASQSQALQDMAAGRVGETRFHSSFLHGQGLVVQLSGTIRVVRGDDGEPKSLLLVVDSG